MFKILVVEDDKELRELFRTVLEKNGYNVLIANDGREAIEVLGSEYVDLVISDVMMPYLDGYGLTKILRESGEQTPVMIITAKDTFDDMKEGFTAGADDYLRKPVDLNEMLLRVSALLRRSQMISEKRQLVGGAELILESFTVRADGVDTVLPQKEFLVLYKLASYPGKIFTKQQIMDEIWGYESDTDQHSVEVHIGRLRERFRDGKDFDIVTIRGVGYKLVKKAD